MALIVAGLLVMLVGPLLLGGLAIYVQARVLLVYIPRVARIFQEKPLFVVPRGQPRDDAEVVRFVTRDGLTLHGCYFRTPAARRSGVLLFGLEFGSNCWSAWSYVEHLVAAGFDVFAFESRNQGDSDSEPGYEPIQWVTNHEGRDAKAAIAYLKARPDADPRGIGLFGISKGAGAGMLAASRDAYVLCAVTDGMFATRTTLVPYMRHWVKIYTSWFPTALLPDWYYSLVAWLTLRQVRKERRCKFPPLERAVARFRRPLLMIHGAQDAYIKPDMARALFDRASGPREFWLVEGAKHNQALHLASDEYRRRVLAFFEAHLVGEKRFYEASLTGGFRCCVPR